VEAGVTPEETIALVRIAAIAHDRTVPDGMAEVWHVTLADLPFGLARAALVELLRTSPYWPKPADVHERARLVKYAQDRQQAKQHQIEGRVWAPSKTPRTGAAMTAHVLGRLKDAGQNAAEGVFLGTERAGAIAEEACREWLAKTSPEDGPDPLLDRLQRGYADPSGPEPVQTACVRCYAPTVHHSGLCGRCQPGGTT
jgi:hypothetical protein